MPSNNKNVRKKRDRSTYAQKEYVRGLVHNLSLQRLTDQEISDYLRNEKNIDLARITVNGIRRSIEKQAEKWYIELRHSRYKFIAVYKERIDSLLSYQKKLHQIIDFYIKPPDQMLYTDTVIRAISELHKIEVSLFNLWKELPDFGIVKGNGNTNGSTTAADGERLPVKYLDPLPGIPHNPQYDRAFQNVYGVEFEPSDAVRWVQCSNCKRWWREQGLLDYHQRSTVCRNKNDDEIPPVE